MRPALLVLAAAAVPAAGIIWAAAGPSVARVVCHDPERGYLSADMPLTSVTQTPGGWVLYFPRGGLSSGRNVEVWQECEVNQ